VKLKLDENLSRYLKPVLTAGQHDVSTVADEGLLAQPDSVVASAARTEGRILIMSSPTVKTRESFEPAPAR
jgi:predicted nuclease of predicted toxin-antitoxin system